MPTRQELIEELYTIPGKAEIVGDRIVYFDFEYARVGYAKGEILYSLHSYEKRTQSGRAVSCNSAFLVELPNRTSFSPDAAFFIGSLDGMDFFEGAPIFAVEVRTWNPKNADYGTHAERAMLQKRADYFAAGTQVVWDVDLLVLQGVNVYRASDPQNPTFYGRGEIAEAEPAVPGWSMPVDDLFPPAAV